MIITHPIIAKYIDTKKYNAIYSLLPCNRQKRLNIYIDRFCFGKDYSDFETQVIQLLLMRHFLMLQ
jgi:hypothetical protein